MRESGGLLHPQNRDILSLEMGDEVLKPLVFVGSSYKDLLDFPKEVVRVVGFALELAQAGELHPHARPLRGFGGAGVLEVIEDFDGNAYRAVYTVRFEGVLYCLHAFQKK